MRSRSSHGRRIAVAAILAIALPQAAIAEGAREPQLTAFATVSPFAVLHYPSDGHGPSGMGGELGLGGSATWRPRGWFHAGLGLRYDLGGGRRNLVHLVSAPATAALVLQMAKGRELQLGIGFGAALGFAAGYAEGGGVMCMLGLGGEAWFGYSHPDGDGMIWLVQAGARMDLIPELNADPDWYLDNGELLHVQLPFVRFGVGWR